MSKSEDILKNVVLAADSKRAADIVALDMQKISLLADYFVIMEASSTRQIAAISEAIQERVERLDHIESQVEGGKDSQWLLIDLKDVVVHIFVKDARQFYNLEKLWSQAPRVDLNQWLDQDV